MGYVPEVNKKAHCDFLFSSYDTPIRKPHFSKFLPFLDINNKKKNEMKLFY